MSKHFYDAGVDIATCSVFNDRLLSGLLSRKGAYIADHRFLLAKGPLGNFDPPLPQFLGSVADLPKIQAMARAGRWRTHLEPTFKVPETKQQFYSDWVEQLIKDPEVELWRAPHSVTGETVGYMMLRKKEGWRVPELALMQVTNQYLGYGFGGMLESWIPQMTKAVVYTDNLGWYLRKGWRVVATEAVIHTPRSRDDTD
jgi:hypothetical protein